MNATLAVRSNGRASLGSKRERAVSAGPGRTDRMRTTPRRWAWLLGIFAATTPCVAVAQSPATDDLLAARGQVVTELVASLPAELPTGALAILPPKVAARSVAPAAAETWAAAMAEALLAARPEQAVVDRGNLEAVLREQKFGDSAYADPKTAVEVGKLVAARTLLATRLHEFRLERGRVRVSLEASLVDVETGATLWSRDYRKGILPWWAKAGLAVVVIALTAMAWRAWRRARHRALVAEHLPRAKQEARIDVDGLARAATDARERARAVGQAEAAAELQKAWVELDAALDRVRHALPGGAVDRSSVRDLNGALADAGRIGALVDDLRRDCARASGAAAAARDLAAKLRAGAGEIRAAVDRYRKHLP